MNLTANRLQHTLQLLAAAYLLLVVSFIGMMPRAVAMGGHAMHTEQSKVALECASSCARAVITSPATAPKETETRMPDPDPREFTLYYQQFQAMSVPKKLHPAAVYTTVPGRPPDRVKLSGHFLF